MPVQHYEGELLAPLWELLQDPSFRNSVAALPGYDVEPMGTLIANIDE